MEFRILGPVQIHDARSDLRIVPTGAKQRALLGALVVKAGQVVSADRLVDELWGEHPPANAANALQAHVARLRRLLPVPAPGSGEAHHEWLVTRPLGYVLRLGRSGTDAQRFRLLTAEGSALAATDPGRSADVLREALALWRGPALEGSERGTICSAEASLLEESRLVALETLFDACLRAGRFGEITGELEELTVRHPLRERFYELLMTALYRSGRQAEALGVYDRARRRLVHDLGLEPGPVLRGRMEAILHHHDPDAAQKAWLPPAHDHDWSRDGGPRPGPSGGGADAVGPADATADATEDEDEASVHLLREEIVRLRRHVERLSREQQELITRFDRLTTPRAAAQ
ncbi:AfsR/SARP family transcriptional regulator [Streptomyces sp. NBC_01408]|uniref:AfsR/SARP family transcriptional regulator n=1 Tax=Streptomyces sp. NBC_01408 TaxID=2903855 RepID=UPI00224CF761|nr:AfsR/SARP family transcriptional regulator [Streptomyces sp. NBC_01408]MCX4696866.1 AfsR/SARP family transcriptional regulator [Streptomyces sp. NBC_01408]